MIDATLDGVLPRSPMFSHPHHMWTLVFVPVPEGVLGQTPHPRYSQPGRRAAGRGHSTLSSHSVSADAIVFRHNLHCICSRRGWKLLLQQTPGLSGSFSLYFFFNCTPRPSAAAGTCGPSYPPSPLLNSSSGR